MASIFQLVQLPAVADTTNCPRLVRDSVVELLATAVFVYSGTLSALSTGSKVVLGQGQEDDIGRLLPISMAFGISIMALAYSIGHITGGHMNPAVTFLMFLRRQVSFTKMCSYIVCQLAGALAGSALVWGSTSGLSDLSSDGITTPPFLLGSTTKFEGITTGNAFLLELMGSFFFFLVIAQTALDQRGVATTSFPPIPIGFVLVVVHICLVPFTGCGVNPARTFGPSMMVCLSGNYCGDVVGDWYWIYYVAPFLAAFLVAEVTLLMETNVDSDDELAASAATKPNKDEVVQKGTLDEDQV